MSNDFKKKIIHAIQNQFFINIKYRKEKDNKEENIEIAPYDLYPMKKKGSNVERDMLLGYRSDELMLSAKKCILTIYLDNIVELKVLDDKFVGKYLRESVKAKKDPYVKRDW